MSEPIAGSSRLDPRNQDRREAENSTQVGGREGLAGSNDEAGTIILREMSLVVAGEGQTSMQDELLSHVQNWQKELAELGEELAKLAQRETTFQQDLGNAEHTCTQQQLEHMQIMRRQQTEQIHQRKKQVSDIHEAAKKFCKEYLALQAEKGTQVSFSLALKW